MRIASARAIEALAARLVAALAPVAPTAPVRDPVQAGSGARLISQIVENSKASPVRTPRGVLLPAGEADPGKLLAALRTALAESGLSYEAHLAEWARAERPREALQREPQASLPAATPEAPVREEAMPIVRQQLEFLEHGHAAWRGEAWPGVPLEWEIETRAAPVVSTFLHVTLPRLGRIEIALTLARDALDVAVVADSESSARRLRESSSDIAAALAARGLALGGFRITNARPA